MYYNDFQSEIYLTVNVNEKVDHLLVKKLTTPLAKKFTTSLAN